MRSRRVGLAAVVASFVLVAAIGPTSATTSTTTPAAALPAFYTVPDPLPAGGPGALIKSEDLGPVPGGERYRVMYHSRSIQGADIAVTGLVFVPSTPAPAKGRPVLAWAHGTTGEADQCAPSLGGYDPVYLTEWLARGYVVAATDYQGLGTPGLHPYLVGDSEGRGVLDSVRAAEALPGSHASDTVMIFGHSQGGHAALFANQLAPTYAPELHVLGTIAAAPASQLYAAWNLIETSAVVGAAVILMGAAFADQYPALRLSDVYTPEAIARMGVVDTGCQSDVEKAYADLTGPEIVKRPAADVPAWRAALLQSEPGYQLGESPVLVVHGTDDDEVPYIASQVLVPRMCSTGQVVDFVTYPGQTHEGILTAGQTTMLHWADERLAGAPAPDTCPPPAQAQPAVARTAAPALTG